MPRAEPGKPDSRELISKLLSDNEGWLRPAVKELAYAFSMTHTEKDDLKEITIQYMAPNQVIVTDNGRTYEREVENRYDPHNSAYPPRLITILQGVTFFGPLQQLNMFPEDHAVSVVREEVIDGRAAWVLRLIPAGQPSERAISEWEERLRKTATRQRCMYELVPVEKAINGEKRGAIELRCLFEEGPSWIALHEALKANPARLKWRRQTYTALMLECRDEKRPLIVVDGYGYVRILPRAILEEGGRQLDEALFSALKAVSRKPEPYLAMRVGCGVWGCWYGYSGGGAEVEEVWIDKTAGLVLREEGFWDGNCRFTIEYGDFGELAGGKLAPRHVAISLFSEERSHPWVFDMTFAIHDGTAWLLQRLTEFRDGRPVARAWVSDVAVSR